MSTHPPFADLRSTSMRRTVTLGAAVLVVAAALLVSLLVFRPPAAAAPAPVRVAPDVGDYACQQAHPGWPC